MSTVISLGIAAMLAGIKGLDPFVCVIYSLCIGMMCWLTVEALLLAFALMINQRWLTAAPSGPVGWPGWHWVSLGVLVAIPLAYSAGNLMGNLITGQANHGLDAHSWRSYSADFGCCCR